MRVRRFTKHVRTKIRDHARRLRYDDRRGWNAEMALIRYGRWAVPALLAALASDCPVSRFRAAYALGKIGDSEVVGALVQVALCDGDHRVRYDAVVALRDIGDARAVPALHEIAASERTDETGVAMEALESCSPKG